MRKLMYMLPLLVLLGGSVFFWLGLQRDAKILPSALIDQPVPALDLPGIPGYDSPGFTNKDLIGQVTLVNIFGSWCIACLQEHPFLIRLKEENRLPIYGIDWRDKPEPAIDWLRRHGDPYHRIGFDADSRTSIDFGVTGAPESFVVDRQGVIRYKHVGVITPKVWEKTIEPIVRSLEQQ